MLKIDLIKEISTQTGLSQKDASSSLQAFIKILTKSLKKGESTSLVGFGTFKVIKAAARKGRNPRTGKELQIKASKRVKFTPGKTLKDSVK